MFACISATGIAHLMASVQKIIYRFIDVFIVRAAGLALSQCRDTFVEESLRMSCVVRRASVSETSVKLTLSSMRFFKSFTK